MRKLYLFLSLALLLCNINVMWGRVEKGEAITAPADGMTIAFNRIAWSNKGEEANVWLCASSADEDATPTFLENVAEPSSNTAAWILETSGTQIDGHDAFYLKNCATQSYLTFTDNTGSFEEESITLALIADKTSAKTFIIVNTKVGVPLLGVDPSKFEEGGDSNGKGGPLKDNHWMIMSKADGDWCALNTVQNPVFMGNYADFAAWYTVYNVSIFESTISDIQDALNATNDLINIKGGTAPGCFPLNLVEAYNTAREEAYALTQHIVEPSREVANAAINKLRDAYDALKAAKQAPVVTGYYRIVSAYSAYEEKQEGQRYAMYPADQQLKWGALNETSDAYVWYIEAVGNDRVNIQNLGNALYIVAPDNSGTSQPVNKMGKTPTDKVTITFFENASSGRIKINGSGDFHTAGHGGGTGTGGNIVFYNGGANDGSAWFIEPVSAEDAAKYDAIRKQAQLNLEFNELLAQAEEKYNIAAVYEKVGNEGYLKNVDQLSSNADHNALLTEEQKESGFTDGQGLPALIDNDIHTFFHSMWVGNENSPKTYHNLTVDLKTSIDKFAFSMTPRKYTVKADGTVSEQNALNNRPTEIVLYGAEAGADIEQPESWTKLRTITGLPDSNVKVDDDKLTFTSVGYPLFGEYQYLRFEVTKTNNGANLNGFPFFTMAEFQIFDAALDPTSQMSGLGQVGKDFEEAYKTALKVTTPTQADIDVLRAALEAFIKGGLADPTELKAILDEANAFAAGIIEVENEDDTQPGKYPFGTQDELLGAIEIAQAYYEASTDYTVQGLKETTEELKNAYEKAKAAIFQLDTHTWYRIRHCQTFYEVNNVPELQPENRTGEVYMVEDNNTDSDNSSILYGTQEDQTDDQFLWRLVETEDGRYVIQNKATNLYIGGFCNTRNYAKASLNPAVYTVESVGYAAFALTGTELNNQPVDSDEAARRNILHAQTDGKVLVYWSTKGAPVLNADKTAVADNSGASWEFIPQETIYDEDVEDLAYNATVAKGQLQTACYPFSTNMLGDGLCVYSVAGISEDGTELYLSEEGQEEVGIKAGKPVFYTVGDQLADEYIAPTSPTVNDSTVVTINVNTDFISNPLTENGLVGHFWITPVAATNGVAKVVNGKNVIAPLAENTIIGANKAYFNKFMNAPVATEGDLTITISGDLNTAIQNAIADKQNSQVDVYTIDGIRVRQAVKYGEATEGLQKGLYIINKKVVAID
ncbi:MAG: hypothetical protein NC388_08085 [Clostridium sp.]|nr:hypothetical protein [Clostridium sp.]